MRFVLGSVFKLVEFKLLFWLDFGEVFCESMLRAGGFNSEGLNEGF